LASNGLIHSQIIHVLHELKATREEISQS